MINRTNTRTAKIAYFAVIHGIYFEQFPGLEENLRRYHRELLEKIQANNVEVIDFGFVDSSEKAFEVANEIQKISPDVCFCNMITYATSSVFAPIMKSVNAPMVLLALQPRSAMDYTKANTFMQLENDNICSVPEFTGVAIRFGKKIADIIIGTLYDDEEADKQISDWCDVAIVLHALKGARLGLMGHVLEAMYDMHCDPTALSAAFGVHVPLIEIEDLVEAGMGIIWSYGARGGYV